MAQTLRTAFAAALRRPQSARLARPDAARPCVAAALRWSSTTTSPPLLDKIKSDLKSAMRAKDAPRLAVLRAIISGNNNAAKTAKPIQTDLQLVGLMRKIHRAAEEAVADAKAAERQDVVDKETEQMRILDEYMASSGVESMGEAQLRPLVQDAVAASKAAGIAAKGLVGDVMKRLSGALEGKDVDKKQVMALVTELKDK